MKHRFWEFTTQNNPLWQKIATLICLGMESSRDWMSCTGAPAARFNTRCVESGGRHNCVAADSCLNNSMETWLWLICVSVFLLLSWNANCIILRKAYAFRYKLFPLCLNIFHRPYWLVYGINCSSCSLPQFIDCTDWRMMMSQSLGNY